MNRTPLIVTCAFGTAQARILQLSLQSLRSVGCYAGRVALLTDLSPRALVADCPRAAGPGIDIVRVPIADELAGRLCRYDLHRHVAAADHAPILCVDADIIFDRPVTPMLDAASLAARICFPADIGSSMASHAMGGQLLRALGRFETGCGFHAGAFAVPDGATPAHQATLARLADTARALWTAKPTLFRQWPLFPQWIDQPVANYLHAQSGCTLFDTDTIATFFRWASRDEVPSQDPACRRGVVHFADAHRIERMRRYFERLAAPAGGGRAPPPSWNAARPVVKLPPDLGRGMADVDTRLVYGAFDRRA